MFQHITILVIAVHVIVAKDAVAADQEPAKRTIRVQVVGPEDRPMPGVKIHASIWAKEPTKGNRDYICDDDGRVFVELPQAVDILRLWATAPGYVGLFANWGPKKQLNDVIIPDEFTFRLEKGTVIGGVVRNEDNQPIEGAKVAVMLVTRPGDEVRNLPFPTTWLPEGSEARVTDAEGRWSIDNVPAGDDVEVRVLLTHPDYVSDYVWGKLQNEQSVTTKSLRERTGVIVMPRGIVIGGFLVDENLKKITDALVVWGDDPYFQQGSQEVHADENGTYHLPPLPTGPMTVTVIASGWAPDQKKIDLSPENNRVNFTLKRGKSLTIRFIDRQGIVIPGVYVGIDEWRGGKALYNHKHPNVLDTQIPVRANEKGVFEWTWAPDDPVTYTFYHEKQQPQGARMLLTTEEGDHEITLPAPVLR